MREWFSTSLPFTYFSSSFSLGDGEEGEEAAKTPSPATSSGTDGKDQETDLRTDGRTSASGRESGESPPPPRAEIKRASARALARPLGNDGKGHDGRESATSFRAFALSPLACTTGPNFLH